MKQPIMNKKYHYFYKIVNEITKEFYYGIHSTDNINDGYPYLNKPLK